MRKITIRSVKIIIFLIMLIFPACECGPAIIGDSRGISADETALARVTQAAPEEPEVPTAAPMADQESTPVPEGSPEIVLSFSAGNMMDLPGYRANLNTPIGVDQTGSAPWVAAMQADRQDDYQALGGLQPGLVHQKTTFNGFYDPATGKLTGTLEHHYQVDAQGTGDALASQTDYQLTCTLDTQRVGDTNSLEGSCAGQSTENYTVPGYSEYNRSQTKTVTYAVTGTLPEALLAIP